jgi:hypothetical protein
MVRILWPNHTDSHGRSLNDADGPEVARIVYEELFRKDYLDLDDVAYALDDAVRALRTSGVDSSRWALFMHTGG